MTKKKTKRNVDKQNITHPTIKITHGELVEIQALFFERF